MKNCFMKRFYYILACVCCVLLSGCASDEMTVDGNNTSESDSVRLVFNSVEKNPGLLSKSTRVVADDNSLETNGSFSYQWEKGDTLSVVRISDGKTVKITADNAGTTATFSGTVAWDDIAEGEEVALMHLTSNVVSTSSGIEIDLLDQTGLLEDTPKYNPLYGKTTISKVQMVDGVKTAYVNAVSVSAQFSVIGCYIKTTKPIDFLACSINDMANGDLFNENIVLSYSGEVTLSDAKRNHCRATIPKGNTLGRYPYRVNKDGTYYLTPVYFCVPPISDVTDKTFDIKVFEKDSVDYKEIPVTASLVTSFEKSHFYRIGVDFTGNDVKKVGSITLPGMPFSFSSGLLYASRDNNTADWRYNYYTDQGAIKGVTEQNDLFAEYFCWGDPDPMHVNHYYKTGLSEAPASDSDIINKGTKVTAPSKYSVLPEITAECIADNTKTYEEYGHNLNSLVGETYDATEKKYGIDVARLPDNGIFHSPTLSEANQILKYLQGSDKENCAGGYYSKTLGKTVYGTYIGTTTVPSQADQDKYVFLVGAGDLNYKSENNPVISYSNGTGYLYYYGTRASFNDASETLHQVSYWTDEPGQKNNNNESAHRLQYKIGCVSSNDTGTREIGYARVIRGVVY